MKVVGMVVRGVLVAFAAFLAACEPAVAEPKPIRKVVLITIDTLRADRLSSYGYKRPTSPHIDALARRGVLFERAMAQAPWTGPSMASVLTGLYPAETGVLTNNSMLYRAVRKYESLETLPKVFAAAGIPSAWFNTNPVLMWNKVGFRGGFSRVVPSAAPKDKIPYSRVESSALDWLDQHADGDFFLWIHNMDPHAPPTEGNPYFKDKKWRVYDAEIRLVDDAIGRLLEKLEDLGISEEVLLIFTADHGEAFSEHMLPGHQNVIYDEVLHVPLIIRYPGMGEPRRLSEPVELVDLYRTIADLADLPVAKGVRGESLVPLIKGQRIQRNRRYSFHSRYYVDKVALHYLAVRDAEHKLIVRVPYGEREGRRRHDGHLPRWQLRRPGTSIELYNYATDKREKVNLIFFGGESSVVERLTAELLRWRDGLGARTRKVVEEQPEAAKVDDAALETLRKLGYEVENSDGAK